MYKVHQGATVLPLDLQTPDYKFGEGGIPAVSASASRDAAGKVHISFVNADPHHAAAVACSLAGLAAKSVTGRVLTAPEVNSINTFDHPDTVKPAPFTGAQLLAGNLQVTLPAKSIVVLEVL